MSRVTGKLQVAVPKGVAQRYGIRPDDEVLLRGVRGGHSRRAGTKPRAQIEGLDIEARLRLFDAPNVRQRTGTETQRVAWLRSGEPEPHQNCRTKLSSARLRLHVQGLRVGAEPLDDEGEACARSRRR